MSTLMARAALLAGLGVAAGLAQASSTNAAFADIAGSVATDGFNNLIQSRVTTTELVAGIAGNIASSGGAVFSRTAGQAYPASFGIYQWTGSGSSFQFQVSDAVDGLRSITLQTFISVDTSQGVNGLLGSADLPRLSFNGGSQFIAATTHISNSVSGGVAMDGTPLSASPNNPNYNSFSWDLSAIGQAIDSFTISFGTDVHTNSLAFQLDQVAAVPEPSTYALGLIGLGLCAGAGYRRHRMLMRPQT